MSTAIFIPHSLSEALAAGGRLELEDDDQMLLVGGGRYHVREAVRVLREVANGADELRLCGTVQLREYLTDDLGAELFGTSLLFDESAYDIVAGWLADPVAQWPAGAAGTPGGERNHLRAL